MPLNIISWFESNFTYEGRVPRDHYIAVSLFYWGFCIFLILFFKLIFEIEWSLPFNLSDTSVLLLSSVILFIVISFGLPFTILIVLFVIFQTIRRLHDIGFSGCLWPIKFLVISFIPVGLIFDLILFTVDGTPGENCYGEDPKRQNFTRL
jgi:Predicted membrane protein